MAVVSNVGLRSLFFFSNLGGGLSERENYYHESHQKRWERRYQRPYPWSCGKIGTFSGIRWKTG